MRIDVHHHALIPEWRSAMEEAGADRSGGAALPPWSVQAALDALDRAQVDAAVLSLSEPGVFQGKAASVVSSATAACRLRHLP